MNDSADIKKYVDMDGALTRMRGNTKLYRKMLQLFSQSAEFAAFEESVAQGDYAKAGDVAHAIKGMTGNLSMPMLFELSARLMTELRDGVCDAQLLADYREAAEATRKIVDDITLQLDSGNI